MTPQLLLVDDEPGLREAVKDYLEASNFKVQVASNARDAWDWMQQNTPDLVISDIMMPQVDGYQFLKQLRDDTRFKTLPVIFLTAKGMTGDRIQGYQAGVDAYLPKPFDPDELVAIVENLLARRIAKTSSGGEEGETPDLAELASQIAQIKALLTQKTGITQSSPPFNIDLTSREQSSFKSGCLKD
ncbi:MAG: response regulator [Nostocaceae cyanobacterium CSU_2_110]|nr:response regulator [Nostocaceae cyanobacterium CSU_2_110]